MRPPPENPLILIPAFNEEASIREVVQRAKEAGLPACVIDDGSFDNTGEAARQEGATVLTLPVNLGVGGALRCGFRYAVEHGHDVVVQVDGDGQHDPHDAHALLGRMNAEGADMVVGSRFLIPSGYEVDRRRRLMMRVLARRASRSLGTEITDATSGFRAIRSPLLDGFAREYPVEYLGDTYEALIIAARRGARVVEQPIVMSPRRHGRPSAGLVASIWYLVRVMLAARLVPDSPRSQTSGGLARPDSE